MSIKDCLDRVVADGAMTPEERDAVVDIYDKIVREYGSADAAKIEVAARLRRDAAQRTRAALLQEKADLRNTEFLSTFKNARGEADPARALVWLLEHHGQVAMPHGMDSVASRQKSILGLWMEEIEEALHTFRPTIVTGGMRETARADNVFRELHGVRTGDAAAEKFAKGIAGVFEDGRQRYNAAGGAIAKRKDFGMPQIHDRRALLAVTKEKWVGDIIDLLAPENMRHPLTGQPMTRDELRESLAWIYDDRTTDGWHERAVTARKPGGGALYRQRGDHRFLVFRDADAALAYHRQYGGGANVAEMVVSHLEGLSKDIAAMEVLGPNPRAGLDRLANFVRKQAKLATAGKPALFPKRTEILGKTLDGRSKGRWKKAPESYADSAIALAEQIWDLYRGNAGSVVDRELAEAFQTVRNINTWRLGGAAISSIADVPMGAAARSFVGLPAARVMKSYVDQMIPGGIATMTPKARRAAQQAGLITDSYLHLYNEGARQAVRLRGPNWTAYIGDRTIALGGLNAHTTGGRHAMGLDMMAGFADLAGRGFAGLPSDIRKVLMRYGLNEADWDKLRVDPETGQTWRSPILRPSDVHRAARKAGTDGDRLAERYLGMIMQETDYASPTRVLRARAAMMGGTRAGTWPGELWRAFMQFKEFPVTLQLLQFERVAREMLEGNAGNAAAIAGGLAVRGATRTAIRGALWGAAIFTAATLGGALSMVIKDILAGKDPRAGAFDPGDGKFYEFWGAAALQGGGAGIYGDLLASEQNRFGGGLGRTAVGPTGDLVGYGIGLLFTPAASWLADEKTNVGREITKGSRYLPGSSLWYLRLIYQRTLVESLQDQVDPDAAQAFRRRAAMQQRDYGSGFWWAPGSGPLPQRLPQFGGR